MARFHSLVYFVSGSAVRRGALAMLAAGWAATAAAQSVTYTIDPKASLAWWEMNPNLSHLWATTCPEDPAWQPGEGHSVGYAVDYLTRREASPTKMSDTMNIPLYPRRVVRSLCTPAVTGQIVVADTVGWRGVRGTIAIRSEHLKTGLDFRDAYARKAIYSSDRYPEIRFEVDSLVDARRVGGDTLRANAVGTLTIRGVRTPLVIPVRGTWEGGGVRVRGQTHVPAAHLVDVYGVSGYALGLSVGLRVWKQLWMGLDVLLRPATGQ